MTGIISHSRHCTQPHVAWITRRPFRRVWHHHRRVCKHKQ